MVTSAERGWIAHEPTGIAAGRSAGVVHTHRPRPLRVTLVDRVPVCSAPVKPSDDSARLARILHGSGPIDAQAASRVHERHPRVGIDEAGAALVGPRCLAHLARDIDEVSEARNRVATGLRAAFHTTRPDQERDQHDPLAHHARVNPASRGRNPERGFR